MMKRLFVSVLAALTLLLCLTTVVYADTLEQEGNNDAASATPIKVNENVVGALADASDADWYRFELPEDGYVVFRANNAVPDTTGYNWILEFYHEDAQTKVYGADTHWNMRSTEDVETAQIGLPAGVYYISVTADSGSTHTASEYMLQVDYTAAPYWETEVNGSVEQADPIAVNQDYFGTICGMLDADWYRFTVPENGVCVVKFVHPVLEDAEDQWKLSLHRQDGTCISFGDATPAEWLVPPDRDVTTGKIGLRAGEYYIKVDRISEEVYDRAGYLLRVSHTPSEFWEQEGSDPQPCPIKVNTDYSGNLCFLGDNDLFEFQLATTSRVIVSLTPPDIADQERRWEFRVYNREGSVMQSHYADDGGAPASLDMGQLPAGSYIVDIYTGGETYYSGADYTLRVGEVHEHAAESMTQVQEPTCSEPGIREGVCAFCDFVVTEQIPTLAHQYGGWITDTEPGCVEPGQKHRVCICGAVEKGEIPVVDHVFGDPVRVRGNALFGPIVYQQTCTGCALARTSEDTRYMWILPALGCLLLVVVLLIGIWLIYHNRRKIFKTHFTCPYCFTTQKRNQVQFRCTNRRCRELPDIEMTRYENGDVNSPRRGKMTFRGEQARWGRHRLPQSAACPVCSKQSHMMVCPACHNVLPESSLTGENMIISVVGASDAGKSHFIGVLIHELVQRIAPAFDGTMEPFDETKKCYEQHFEHGLYLRLEKLHRIPHSPCQPMIYTLKLHRKHWLRESLRSYTLVFLDNVGEDLGDAAIMQTTSRYLRQSAGVIILLDPIRIPAVTRQLSEDACRRASAGSRGYADGTDDILIQVSNLIRESRGLRPAEKINVPVAVAFSKCDVIAPLLPRDSAIAQTSPHQQQKAFVLSDGHHVDAAVRDLLRAWEADAILAQMESNYKDYACFAVSALGLNNNPTADGRIRTPKPHRIEDPFLWILMKLKVIPGKKD